MIGWDFSVFWQIGQTWLQGGNPYSIAYSVYPPATTILFALFGWLPFLPAYAIWTGANVILFLVTLRRMQLKRSIWAWFLFTPLIFNLLAGQLDVFFFFLAGFLTLGGWPAVVAGVLLTLKPQLAVVVLPWFLVRWLKQNPRQVLIWGAACLALHLIPFAFDLAIYQKWITALQGVSEMKMGVSSGLFSLTTFGLPLWLVGVVAVPIAIWGLFQDELTNRAAQLLAFPITIWYDDVLLAGSNGVRWLVPYSLVIFAAAYAFQNNLPLATIPLAVLIYRLYEKRRNRLSITSQ